jgi:hypothetical protein
MSSSDPPPTSCRRCCFVEIVHPPPPPSSTTPPRPEEWIDCYVMPDVDPKSCGALARDLNSALPLRGPPPPSEDGATAPTAAAAAAADGGGVDVDAPPPLPPRTDHLKRIRRRPATVHEMRAREAAAGTTMSGEGGGAPSTTDGLDGGDDGDAASPSSSTTTMTATMGGANDDGHRAARKRARNGGRRPTATTPRREDAARPWSLDLLVGSVAAIERAIRASAAADDDGAGGSLVSVLGRHGARVVVGGGAGGLVRRSLPGRPAGTRDELEAWNADVWPTLFFEERTARYREGASALTSGEARAMAAGMAEAAEDALEGRRQRGKWEGDRRRSSAAAAAVDDRTAGGGGGGRRVTEAALDSLAGAVVVNPLDGSIVSRSSEERRLRGGATTATDRWGEGGSGAAVARASSDAPGVAAGAATTETESPRTPLPGGADDDPLCTPVLLAIQGVSRRERLAAAGCGMGSEEFRAGQVSFANGGGGRIDRRVRGGGADVRTTAPKFHCPVARFSHFAIVKYLCTG